ncbi:MAG: site-specific DNA-methyltransferase, partial [Ignavibacterium sp.]|nr:site-specific DNA-methyltransferase [Ignavibacterium sp.]
LHIHERISPQAIIKILKREDAQRDLFADPQLEYNKAIKFYEHDVDWTNRMILGDSLQVMASLAKRENLAGQVQMIYMDPPYGIKFSSNFQTEIGKRDVKDREADLTREPEMIRAYRDTWKLGIHSYLSYMRDRLYLCKELLKDSGSIFVQISDENVHLVRNLLDEVFGKENFVSLISFASTRGFESKTISRAGDYIIWYAKQKLEIFYQQLYDDKNYDTSGYGDIEYKNGFRKKISNENFQNFEELLKESKIYSSGALFSPGYSEVGSKPFSFQNQIFNPSNGHWKTTIEGMERLKKANRIELSGKTIRYVRYLTDFPVVPLNNLWKDTQTFTDKLFVVQTNVKIVQRCLLMTTKPGDLVLDPTCGSGTTAYVAEQFGRRWITIDTSRVAISLARQ